MHRETYAQGWLIEQGLTSHSVRAGQQPTEQWHSTSHAYIDSRRLTLLAQLCHVMSTGAGRVQIYHNRSPIYTMRPQIYVRPLFQTPAPNAYRAEDVVMHKPTIFKKSFGVKHSVFAGAMVNRVTSQCRMVQQGCQRLETSVVSRPLFLVSVSVSVSDSQ